MIKIENVTFKYDNGKKIFDNASCYFPNNGVYIVVGDNGIGKTTLFKILLNQLVIEAGNITIDDIVINKNSPLSIKKELDEKIAYISQKSDLVSFINCIENISLKKIKEEGQIEQSTQLLNYDDFAKRNIESLSNGEKSLTSIERALLENKDILLLDEITDFLDDYNTKLIIDNIEKIAKEKLVILITHDDRIIKRYKNKVIVENKKLIQTYKCNEDYKAFDKKEKNHTENKKDFKYLIKKIFKHNLVYFFLYSIILIILNTCILSYESIISYPFKSNYYKSVIPGNYEIFKKDDLIINNLYISESFNPSSTIDKESLKKVEDNLDILYYNSIAKLNVTLNDNYKNKIYLNSDEYKKQVKDKKIEDGYLTFGLYNIDSEAKFEYEVNDNLPNDYGFLINYQDVKKIKYVKPMHLRASLWSNNIIPFTDKKFFSSSTTLSFLNYDIFELKYGIKVEKEIKDNEIYICDDLKKYANTNEVKFFDFSSYDLKHYYNDFVDLNKIFKDNTKLISDNEISSVLSSNEVLINNDMFYKIIDEFEFKCTPVIKVTKDNIKTFKKFCKKNNFELSELSLDERAKYSIYGLDLFQMAVNERLFLYYSILLMTMIIELCISILYCKAYYIKYSNDIPILKRYYSSKETYFIFVFPLLIVSLLPIPFSVLISSKILRKFQSKFAVQFLSIKVTALTLITVLLLNLCVILLQTLRKYKNNK